MNEFSAPSQAQLERHVLQCLVESSPRSLAAVRDWVGKHAELNTDERKLVKMPSGKESRLFERTIGNLLTPGRSGNLTTRHLVDRPARDTYAITNEGKQYLAREERALADLSALLEGVEFDP